LHVGIAIEGSIGSQMKIDALNISSDLLIAFRIEELNEKYGSEILLTGEVQALLSDKAKDMLREID
jgi:hypothetical protein